MAEIKRNFLSGVMNKDADERIIESGAMRDALNFSVLASEGEKVGSGNKALGNEKVANLPSPQPVNGVTIGAVSIDYPARIYWMVCADNIDAIYELNVNTGTIQRVLLCTKPNSKLGFDESYTITGINVVDGFLIWTDDLNQPRCINIARAKTYSIDDDRIDLDSYVIKHSPLNGPYIELKDDGTQANNLSEKFVYFAYRWKYIDNQYSTLSPFSAPAFIPGKYSYDPLNGFNAAMMNTINSVDVTVETGNEFVEQIQILMIESDSKNAFIVETLDKDELNIPDNSAYKFGSFSNSKIYTSLPTAQLTNLFHNVPLKAKSQELIGNRLVYGNYEQFYDITDENGEKIKTEFNLYLRTDLATPSESAPKKTMRSDRDIEVALHYIDEYGRMTTPLTSQNNTIYVPAQNSSTANSVVLNIDSKAPSWATGWRVSVKQAKGAYYTVFPILFYKDGSYRYFLINDSDVDKVPVGSYVTFKSSASGVTLVNKKYKILEVESKSANFIGSNGTSELAGVYFKIKVESPSDFDPASIFNYSYTSTGKNTTGSNNNKIAPNPVSAGFNCVENPIHYGEGNGSVLTVSNNNQYLGYGDMRYTIEITDNGTKFRYTTVLSGSAPYIEEGVSIVAGSNIAIKDFSGNTMFHVQFSTTTGHVEGDKWKISCRGALLSGTSYFGGITCLAGAANGLPPNKKAVAIIPSSGWSPTSPTETDRAINFGAVVTISIEEDSENSGSLYNFPQTFPPSDRNYENIEEWFVESGAYQQFKRFYAGGWQVGSQFIRFRRGKGYTENNGGQGSDPSAAVDQGTQATAQTMAYPVRMFIPGDGTSQDVGILGQDVQATVTVKFSIQQSENAIIAETTPKENDLDVFHETTFTFPVENGNHIVKWDYDDFVFFSGITALTQLTRRRPHYFEVGQTIYVNTTTPGVSGAQVVHAVPDPYTVVLNVPFVSGPVTPGVIADNLVDQDQNGATTPAVLVLTNPNKVNTIYNAYCWGNGVESNRIRDDFNTSVLEYSVRAMSPIDDYRSERKFASLTWSGVYEQTSSVNGFNDFNLSLANFLDMDRQFGSIQKLFSRDSDMVVFQEDKIHSVLYGKNVLYDSVGGGSVASIPEVFGTQVPFRYEYGISRNPESFASEGDIMFITDESRGSVLAIIGMEIKNISDIWFRNYFRDAFMQSPNTRKIGYIDPHRSEYVLAMNENSSIPCDLTLSRYTATKPSAAPTSQFLYSLSLYKKMFSIFTSSEWTITLDDIGFGTSWVTGFPTSGSGDAAIEATLSDNNTGANRQVDFVVEYCGGSTRKFRLIQSAGKVGTLVAIAYTNSKESDN